MCPQGERLAEVERKGIEVDRVALEKCRDGTEPPRTSLRSDLKNMLKWALVAAAITALFGLVLNVLEAVL